MKEIYDALALKSDTIITNPEILPSRYSVSPLAAHAVGSVGSALVDLLDALNLAPTPCDVMVDQHLASRWFQFSIDPIGWDLPPIWDAIAGDYQTKDGWIKLHTNLPHHRAAVCKVLGVEANRATVTDAVSHWAKTDLEAAIVSEGGVSAAMRSRDEWTAHPQGKAVATEPLIHREHHGGTLRAFRSASDRPLRGLRVLDLTRVLAGPVATRTLAGLGAQVLRIDPPGWQEDNIVPDITLGKRCARLDLRKPNDRDCFETLLRDTDIFIHGYRPDALETLGFGDQWRRAVAPSLIDVRLDAYGWSGPWAARRGFDSLVQMSCGIADAGMAWAVAKKPTPLPVQALDHATGFLMAATAIKAVADLARNGTTTSARLSLARTAELLITHEQNIEGDFCEASINDFNEIREETPWGPAHRLRSPLRVGDVTLRWDRPACELGSSIPKWQ